MPPDRALDDAGVSAVEAGLRIEPFDRHNRELVENVHPPGWVNPRPRERYHLVVVGAGTGGLVSAAIAAGLGAKVALIERYLMGGDCLNVGCVPSKALIRAGRGWAAAQEAHPRFGGPAVSGDGDFAAAMERMRRVRAEISPADSAIRFRDRGVDVFLGDARFTGPDRVDVDGTVLRFRRAIIATGGRPLVPSIPGLEEAGYLTNETVFSLTERPERLVVLGAGPIGCELSQAFARLGSQVTLLDVAERVLPNDDPDAARLVQASLERDGIRFLDRAQVRRAEATPGGNTLHYIRDGERGEVAGDAVLVAVGRAPNVEGLGLDAAEIHHSRRGIEVDDRLRASNPRIYAVGDVCSRFPFTHAADAQARIAVPNALFFGRSRASRLVIPWCTYTSPELAHVGPTTDELAGRGDEVQTLTVPLEEVDRARLDGETEGFLRIHLKKGSDRILAATLVAERAGDIISQITQAMTAGVGLGTLGKTIFPYPTQAEVIRKAADQWRRGKLTPRLRRVFDSYFRVVG